MSLKEQPMLKEIAHRWSWLLVSPQDAGLERQQCIEEGRDFSSIEKEYEQLIAQDLLDPKVQAAMQAMLDRTIQLPIRPDFPYVEPSDLESIRQARGKGKPLPPLNLSHKKLREKLHGAWLGRCCGCLLGKPVEMIPKEDQWAFLKRTNQWPLQYYMTSNPEEDKKFWAANSFFQNIHDGMPIDDDTNYTVIGLNIVKASGKKFQPLDVAAYWLANVPALCTCTAERVAYRNFANLILPPMSGSYRNPYREWIGAQIRADFFGYVCPGNPELAAELAWRDACISHVKNGIYGEMWVAAMLAASFVTDDIVAVIEAGLAQIPQKSRLHEQIKNVIEWYRTGVDFDEALARIHQLSYSPVHTINNAMIVAAALLWGGGDFGKTICLAVQSALDTDCNGATAGSIIGMIAGVRKIPARWSEPLKDTLNTSVAGYTKVSIAAMAEETVKMIESSE